MKNVSEMRTSYGTVWLAPVQNIYIMKKQPLPHTTIAFLRKQTRAAVLQVCTTAWENNLFPPFSPVKSKNPLYHQFNLGGEEENFNFKSFLQIIYRSNTSLGQHSAVLKASV